MEKPIEFPNLIGISGKAGAGKDLVGKMIQYLQFKARIHGAEELLGIESTDFDITKDYSPASVYRIKKFAQKLKQISALILGVPEEMFEDREFKNAPLPPEWNYWEATYIDLESQEHAYYRFKEEPPAYLEDKGYKFIVIPTSINYHQLTGREFLLYMGTEAARDNIHPEIWVNALFADYKETKPRIAPEGLNHSKYTFRCILCDELSFGYKRQLYCKDCVDNHTFYPNWIITDMRFPNELAAVKSRGGLTIRVNREFAERVNHISDSALDNAQFDITLTNNGSIIDLLNQLKHALQHH